MKMSIAKLWEDKEDSELPSVFEELGTIASEPTCRTEDLAELYVLCKDYNDWDALPARTALLKNIARHPNVPPTPEILQDLLDKYPQALLENPALPFLFLENSNLFADADLSLLQCEYIPEYIFEALREQEYGEIKGAIESHWLIAGEVTDDEDYTQCLQQLQNLPIRRKYHRKIMEEDVYPAFIYSQTNSKTIWSPREALLESKNCHQKLKRRFPMAQGKYSSQNKTPYTRTRKIYSTLHQLINPLRHRRDYPKMQNWSTENLRIVILGYIYYLLPSSVLDKPNPNIRLCLALNPRTTKEDLDNLAHDGNRYVRATARAALEMREGS
jgi:hypothetical protein